MRETDPRLRSRQNTSAKQIISQKTTKKKIKMGNQSLNEVIELVFRKPFVDFSKFDLSTRDLLD